MCGRINVSDNEGVRLLLAMLGMEVWPDRNPRFNVAPSQTLDVVSWQNQALVLQSMKWGLLPPWAKPGTFSAPLINARSETIHEKPSFKHLIRNHRVVIPINGFYEWRRTGKVKEPHFVQPANAGAMFIAGLFQPPGEKSSGEGHAQVCAVTVAANESMSKVHHRMPVILSPDNALKWIKPADKDRLNQLMVPASNDAVTISEVSDYVNSARNEGPECVAPRKIDDLFG